MGKRQSARSPCEQPARGKRSARAQPVRRRSPPEQPVTLLAADFHIPPPNNHRQQHKVIDTRRETQPNLTARHGPPTGGWCRAGAAPTGRERRDGGSRRSWAGRRSCRHLARAAALCSLCLRLQSPVRPAQWKALKPLRVPDKSFQELY
ncbi:unnamed protein product [Coccothraustes coccothraustes]